MKDTAPTIEEMREVIHTFEMLSFKELQAQGIFDDKKKNDNYKAYDLYPYVSYRRHQ
ncbi:MAG: hypothetical protein ACLUGQ_07060 [Coprococcus sp.]